MSPLLSSPALLVGLVRAVLILLITFCVAISQAQQGSILELVGAVLAVMSLLLTGVTLARTTPVANPSLPEGTIVEVVTPEGQPNHTAVVV
jgi:hypothetical protein